MDAVADARVTESVDLARPDAAFVAKIPIRFARRFGVLGIESSGDVLIVAAREDAPPGTAAKLITMLGRPVRTVPTEAVALAAAIDEAYGAQSAQSSSLIESLASGESESAEALLRSGDLLDSGGAAPVTRLVNLILLDAVRRRASDVHIQPAAEALRVRLRIDGVLYDHVQPPKHLQEEIVSRIKVMGRMNIAEKQLPQDGRTTVSVGEKTIDLRISALPTCHGERIVIRLLDKSARLYRLPELGMSARDLEVFGSLIRRTHGMILVTGPTGSGKSTTLYAALQELSTTELNVLTLEDPIEYQLDGISQTQVSSKKGVTFATGLRTVLRQDPDVIMAGEIRDEETARMAIQSSLTGHLVFSTLHTNDAAGAIARLLDLGVEPYLVAGSLLGVIAQRLIRRVCTECARSEPISVADAALLGLQREGDAAPTAPTARGCERCHGTGYRDRVGLFEMLKVSDDIHAMITRRSRTGEIRAAARRCGMRSLRDDAMRKLRAGETTASEVLRVTPPGEWLGDENAAMSET